MASPDNGLALIITNDYYGSKMPPLTETHMDGARMAEVFRALRYDVEHHRNLTHNVTQQHFRRLAGARYPSSYRIVVIFSGHGNADNSGPYIITQDCVNFPVTEMIDFFMPGKSRNIAMIPKVFLIDACLGDRDLCERAIPVPKGGEEGDGEVALGKGGRPIETMIVPDKGNYLLAHSTSIGDRSYEIKGQGGVWLNALADTISVKAHTDSVADILSEVNGQLQQKYQQVHLRGTMTQPHFISKLQGVVQFAPKQAGLPKQQSAEQISSPQPLGETMPKGKGVYRAQLNDWAQQKKISEPEFSEPTKSKNGGFLVTVTFKLMSTDETHSYPCSDPKGTVKEAKEEAARVAIKNIDAKERRVPRSAISRQTSSQSSPVQQFKRQPSGDSNPVKQFKESCDSSRYRPKWEEIQTHKHERFQFKVTVTDLNGRVVVVTGAEKGSKREAKYDTAIKANAKFGF